MTQGYQEPMDSLVLQGHEEIREQLVMLDKLVIRELEDRQVILDQLA